MTLVTFQSTQFSSTVRDDAFNEALGGELADWLQSELLNAGYDVGEVIPEDYGYGFWVTINDIRYWVACNEYFFTDDQARATVWMIQAVHDVGCLFAYLWVKRPNPTDIITLNKTIHQSLSNQALVSDIRWWQTDHMQSYTDSPPS